MVGGATDDPWQCSAHKRPWLASPCNPGGAQESLSRSCRALTLLLQVVHKALHAVAPAVFGEPALMPMMAGTIPYRAVLKALNQDLGCIAAVLVGAAALWAARS